ncbi:threonine ammonia-lyase IlvA [Limoniibacter endophyticus]|uniref:L-threonine dehydratase n=1 Tax=Limoniibacter endophyticus TaxID=1565040 RepID=A0A8J3DFE3_9HYPH|nr:threonine ammonia-lyase IlvA [Limoniibacter endophyticus]GHC60866.1 L-threonine dehydratase [Limoniibacter endophyticus]
MTQFLDNVRSARIAIDGLFEPTPLQENPYLSRKYNARIFLKREDLTPVRSYKLRGAFNFIRKALENGSNNAVFTCASAGNHAQGFAYACRFFGRKGVVFMPVTTPQQKIDKTRMFGGEFVEIRLVGDYFDACYRASQQFAADSGAHMVPPFDHEDIIEGQATVGLEVIDQIESEPDLVILPVGGGGLAAGITRILREKGWKSEILFVEPVGAPSLKSSLAKGEVTRLTSVDTFVDGASVAEIGRTNFSHLQQFSEGHVQLVPENRICSTILEMLNVEGVVLEPAGAMSIDALKDVPREKIDGKTVLCVVSGGNFDFERLPEVKERAMRFEGQKKYFIFRFPQRPGMLREFLDMLGPDDDVARFEYLKKTARNFGSVLIGIETTNAANFSALIAKFDESGLQYQDITNDETISGLII